MTSVDMENDAKASPLGMLFFLAKATGHLHQLSSIAAHGQEQIGNKFFAKFIFARNSPSGYSPGDRLRVPNCPPLSHTLLEGEKV